MDIPDTLADSAHHDDALGYPPTSDYFYVLRKGLIIHCPRAYYIIQAGVEFVPILQIQPAEFRDYRHEPPHLGHVTY